MAKSTLHITTLFEESESIKRFRENHGMEYDDFLEMLTDLLEENDEAFEEEMKTFIITIKLMHTKRNILLIDNNISIKFNWFSV